MGNLKKRLLQEIRGIDPADLTDSVDVRNQKGATRGEIVFRGMNFNIHAAP